MSVSRAEVVAAARRWVGVPWLHQGRNRHGVDCAGLLLVVGWEMGLVPRSWDRRAYDREPPHEWLVEALDHFGTRTEAPVAGDVVLLRLTPRLWHCAILSGEHRMIHAWGGRRVAEVTMQPSERRRVAAAYALDGVA